MRDECKSFIKYYISGYKEGPVFIMEVVALGALWIT
jgi:hypothetical protein